MLVRGHNAISRHGVDSTAIADVPISFRELLLSTSETRRLVSGGAVIATTEATPIALRLLRGR